MRKQRNNPIKKAARGAVHSSSTHAARFIDGFLAPIHAMNFLRWHVALLRYTVIPLMLNILIFGFALWFVFARVEGAIDGIIPDTNQWWRTLLIITNIIVFVILLVVAFFLFTFMARIIAAPFNEQLSKATEALLSGQTGEEDEKLTFKLIADDAWRTIKEETLKIAYFVVIQGVLLLLNIIPVVGNIAYIIIATPITWLFTSFDSVDPPLARRKTSIRTRKNFIWSHRALFFGFGLASTLLIAIPILNLFFMPVLIVAGTTLFVEHRHAFEELNNNTATHA